MFSNKSIIGIFTMLILITASVIFIGAGHEKSTEQATGKMTAEQMMTFMDSNGDGRITRDEAPAELKAGFDFFDQNKDGGIDINEAQILADYANNQAAGKMTAEQMMTFMDSNGDGINEVQKPSAGPESLFGLDNVIDVHIRIEPEEWAKLQPPKGTKMDFDAALKDVMEDAVTGGHFRSEKSTRSGLAGYLGVDHQYGKAEVTIDGETVKGIGLRYKGNGTFLAYV